jgi:Fe-S cluster assembly ATP-binding protein
MGHPDYEVIAGDITFNNKDLLQLSPDERSAAGMSLSFQLPLSLVGVKVYQLLQRALSGQKKPLEIRKKVKAVAEELRMSEDLLTRSLNEGASGGEKKKMEVLQAMVLDKEFMIFDEVDTGVDVDSLKIIANFLQKNKRDKTFVIITHYNRILHYLKPDNVLVIADGELKKVGDAGLAEKIEKEGYSRV